MSTPLYDKVHGFALDIVNPAAIEDARTDDSELKAAILALFDEIRNI